VTNIFSRDPSMRATPRQEQRFDEERFELLRELKRSLTSVLETTSSKDLVKEFVLTDTESTVQDLLAWIERCLWHGLKRYQAEDNTPISLWTVVSTHLAPKGKDDENTIDQVLRQVVRPTAGVHTDSGRSRAWVRLALNAGVLGSSLACLNEFESLYDSLSLWRSTEMRSIAVSLLQSLRGLKFALTTTSPSFDTDPEPSRRPHLLGACVFLARSRPTRTQTLLEEGYPSSASAASYNKLRRPN
jgi:hypothetical protein